MESHVPRFHRRSIRLPGYDYSGPGVYFVTMCTWGRLPLFGRIRDGEVRPSSAGRIVDEEWRRSATLRPYLHLDAYVVMPDHMHGVVVWDAARTPVERPVPGLRRPPRSLGSFLARFKASCTKRIHTEVPGPATPVWQRNYFERIIRGEEQLERVRRYIAWNPRRS
ncbi:MAG: transposase [Gemmatimonadales bacterium]